MLFGQSEKREGDEASVYESYQNILQTLMMISTLLMGFIITGAFISVGYSGDATYSQAEAGNFVALSFKAFMSALLALALSLILSVMASQLHGMPGCAKKSTRCLLLFGWVVVFSELCVYGCAFVSLEFVQSFVHLNYVTPSEHLCPGSDEENFDHGKYTFCALVGSDFYDAAVDESVCGPSQPDQPRPYNSSDPKSLICSQLDYYDKENSRKVWFAWDVHKGFEEQTGQPAATLEYPPDVAQCAEYNAKELGEAFCGLAATQKSQKEACGLDPSSTSCSMATIASQGADKCAGVKSDDLMKCHHTCMWTLPWTFFGGEDHTKKYVSIEESYQPIWNVIACMQLLILIWTGLRVLFVIAAFGWTAWWYSIPDRFDPDDINSDEDEDGYEEMEKEKEATV